MEVESDAGIDQLVADLQHKAADQFFPDFCFQVDLGYLPVGLYLIEDRLLDIARPPG